MSVFVTRPHFRIFASFFIYALMLGAIYPRLGDLQQQMGVGEGALGAALIGAALGTQISLAFAQPLMQSIGYRWSMLLAVPMLGIAEVLATTASSPLVFFGFQCVAGLAVGVVEMIINLEADRVEHKIGRRIMSRAHAFWSFGFMAAAYLGAGFAQAHISPTMHLLILLVFVAVLNTYLFHDYVPAPSRNVEEGGGSRFVRPTPAILVLVTFTLSAMILEGASLDWSVIYMRDVHHTQPWLNASTLGIFAMIMAISRFFADGFVERFGPERVARTLVAIMGIGALSVALAPHPAISIFGFACLGIGTSAIFPLSMSAAAQMTDRPAVVNVASLAQISFVTFLLAPPLLGFVAEHFGIRWSYAIGLPFVILSWLTVHRILAGVKVETQVTD
ncbi:MAG: MFS transporter [Hyphomicrobiaceae bacterium]|nr:MFS transporter [Hyphomicrobiaceae bacterium]MCC0023884.1 MFS transporter [Hyphomicrobiaceae bacterium]